MTWTEFKVEFKEKFIIPVIAQWKPIAGVGVLIIIGAIGFTFYQKSINKKEMDLAILVNNMVRQYENIRHKAEKNLSDTDTLDNLGRQFNDLYNKNSSLVNGFRALFFSANYDFERGNYAEARRKYLMIFEKKKKHYLAPNALLYAAISWEEEGKFKEALAHLAHFETYYPTSYLYGLSLMVKGRNLVNNNQVKEATEAYQKILTDKNLSIYADKAKESLKIMALQGLTEAPVAQPKTATFPSFTAPQ